MTFQKLAPLGALLVIGLGVWWLWPRTQGTITIASPSGAIRTENISACSAGFGSQPILFGIHLRTSDKTDVFISDGKLVPGIGTHIELTRVGNELTTIDPKNCSSLVTALTWGAGNIYSDTRNHAKGTISMQCALADGTTLHVEARVRQCQLK